MNANHADRLAEQAIDRYYDDDITDETTLDEYIEDAHLPLVDNWTKEDYLTQALGDDMHDLLKNGNDEDLAWSEADVETIRDGDYYFNLDQIARYTARKLLARIYA